MTAVIRLAPPTPVERVVLAVAAWLQDAVEHRRERRALPMPRYRELTAMERTEIRAHRLGLRR